MRRTKLALTQIVAMLLLAMSNVAVADTPAHASPTSSAPACEQWTTLEPCEVSWYALLANPKAYRGRIVGVTGYLVSAFGNLILYPDKANYESGSETASLLLERPFSIPRDLASQVTAGGRTVYVLARFTTKAEVVGFNTPRAGGLYEIHKIINSQRTLSSEPLNMDGIRFQPTD